MAGRAKCPACRHPQSFRTTRPVCRPNSPGPSNSPPSNPVQPQPAGAVPLHVVVSLQSITGWFGPPTFATMYPPACTPPSSVDARKSINIGVGRLDVRPNKVLAETLGVGNGIAHRPTLRCILALRDSETFLEERGSRICSRHRRGDRGAHRLIAMHKHDEITVPDSGDIDAVEGIV